MSLKRFCRSTLQETNGASIFHTSCSLWYLNMILCLWCFWNLSYIFCAIRCWIFTFLFSNATPHRGLSILKKVSKLVKKWQKKPQGLPSWLKLSMQLKLDMQLHVLSYLSMLGICKLLPRNEKRYWKVKMCFYYERRSFQWLSSSCEGNIENCSTVL